MNKATMISVTPEEFKRIKNGDAQFIFRNYKLQGKVYLYESLGKRVKKVDGCIEKRELIIKTSHNYEGTGKVVAEFVVGECYEDLSCHALGFKALTLNYMTAYGLCSDKTYKCILEYDEALTIGYTNQSHAMSITDLIVYESPIPHTEFVGWNKAKKHYEQNGISLYEDIDYIHQMYYLTTAPRGKVYVVEKGE